LFHDIFLVIDGLDELQADNGRRFTLEMFAKISSSNLHILTTSRLETDIEEAFSEWTCIAMDVEAVRHDITIHIGYRLDHDEKLKKLKPDLKLEIKEKLLQKCDGM
jgi:hypothetical protein